MTIPTMVRMKSKPTATQRTIKATGLMLVTYVVPTIDLAIRYSHQLGRFAQTTTPFSEFGLSIASTGVRRCYVPIEQHGRPSSAAVQSHHARAQVLRPTRPTGAELRISRRGIGVAAADRFGHRPAVAGACRVSRSPATLGQDRASAHHQQQPERQLPGGLFLLHAGPDVDGGHRQLSDQVR